MPSNIQTRSSTRRSKRNLKSPRSVCCDCEGTHPKKMNRLKNQRNSSSTKVKKTTSSMYKRNLKEDIKSVSKKNEKSVLHNGSARELIQSVKQPVVMLTSLSPDVIYKSGEENNTSSLNGNLTPPKTNQHKTKKAVDHPSTTKVSEDRVLKIVLNRVSDNTVDKHEDIFKKPFIEGVRKSLNNNTTPSPPLKLRNRRMVNYAESSLDSSAESQSKPSNNIEKVPVYKQPIVENQNKKRQRDDLYEFDESDSENVKKKKKKKDANSSSDEYDRTVRNILKNVVNKVRKRKKKAIYTDAKNNNETKQIKAVPSLKKGILKSKPNENPKDNENIVAEANVKNVVEKLEEKEKVHQNQILELPQETLSEVKDNNASEDTSTCSGFKNDEITSNRNNNSKIKIISNIQLQPGNELNISMESPARFRESRPKANSTMLNNVFSPWRFNEINVKRNPHFLAIKESSLPCISQDMVLDHTIVDKFEDLSRSHIAKTPQRTTVETPSKKTPVQKYLTDYFGSRNETENKENVNTSLFDNDQFSPIKNISNFRNEVELVKRKILGEKDDNFKDQFSTPKRDLVQSALSPNSRKSEDQYFGFSSDEEEDEVAPKKNKDDRPFRVSVNANDRKYTRPQIRRRVKSPSVEPSIASDEDSEEEEDNLNDVESHSGEVRIFDDLDDSANHLADSRPIKKKTKAKWLNDDTQRPKKKKDMRTKEEEEEAEKWAAAFNSMCEEIEEFPLEIE